MADGVAVLSSGGLDSAVMLVELCQRFERVHPIYVRCGLFWERMELSFLRAFLKAVDKSAIQQIQVLDFAMDDVYQKGWYATGRDVPSHYEADEEWQIPGRNIILTAKVAVWCRLHAIDSMAHGTLNGNPFADSTLEFFGLMEGALSRGLERRLKILTPLRQLDKSEVVLMGRSLSLKRTLSCPVPVHNSHCGICGKCRERISAFARAGVSDPTSYHEKFQEGSQELQRLGTIGG